jgi:predicted phosphodiesterase
MDKMTLTRLIGDIHGQINDYKVYSIGNFEGPTIQIGDFGIGFGQSDYWHESIDAYHMASNNRFIRGNHDNPAMCKTMSSWIKDGTVENDVMFIGGAWSIDNPNAPPGWYKRTAGYDWWPEEELSQEELERMIDIYSTVRPRVMITHDCPRTVSREMFFNSGLLNGPEYPNRTSTALELMFEIHQPEFWYFGHWHFTRQYSKNGTVFQCIGELEYVDVEL